MKQALAIALLVGLCAPAMAGEDETIQLKIFVDGMSCPTGCAPKVAKGLSAVTGAKEVKLADFDAGLFTVAFDSKAALDQDAFKKNLGEYKVKKIELTVTGTMAKGKEDIVLTTAAGPKYVLSTVNGCSDDKAPAKKDAPTVVAPIAAKIEALLKEGKTTVKVTGQLGGCCEAAIIVAAIDPIEVKKPAN